MRADSCDPNAFNGALVPKILVGNEQNAAGTAVYFRRRPAGHRFERCNLVPMRNKDGQNTLRS